jgi:hypothetical protein
MKIPNHPNKTPLDKMGLLTQRSAYFIVEIWRTDLFLFFSGFFYFNSRTKLLKKIKSKVKMYITKTTVTNIFELSFYG